MESIELRSVTKPRANTREAIEREHRERKELDVDLRLVDAFLAEQEITARIIAKLQEADTNEQRVAILREIKLALEDARQKTKRELDDWSTEAQISMLPQDISKIGTVIRRTGSPTHVSLKSGNGKLERSITCEARIGRDLTMIWSRSDDYKSDDYRGNYWIGIAQATTDGKASSPSWFRLNHENVPPQPHIEENFSLSLQEMGFDSTKPLLLCLQVRSSIGEPS
jgi:hypothetical protein